ncbi:MAG: cell envelope integrity protein CreD [Calditrichia bacterium]
MSKVKTSLGMRLAIIGFLTFVLLIPSFMVMGLISDRQSTRSQAISEVSSKWGQSQQITGPLISIPYKEYLKDQNDKVVTVIKYAHFLPDELSVDSEVEPEVRYRGIYEVVLYHSSIKVNAAFSFPDFESLNIPEDDLLLEDAFISLGISDMSGINDLIYFNWNSSKLEASPGIKTNDVLGSGISSPIPLSKNENSYRFAATIDLNGSETLSFSPIGKETKAKVSANWGDPSFTGNFLPDSREINEAEGTFSAEWKILHLNRNFPQRWVGSGYNINYTNFGVNFFQPVDQYQQTMRTAKYAIMFIAMTFLAFFLIELLNKKVLHPIQYLLIGFALLVFYTLLLSFSEHMTFQNAYWLSSLGIIGLITAYTRSVLGDKLQTIVIAGVLLLLYGYLYIVLQLEDFALLMGSLMLFIVLSVVMYLTRKIDWFNIMKADTGQFKK